MDERRRFYKPTRTFAKFHADDNLVRILQGPFGSGKSTACVAEIIFRAMDQAPFRGVRRSRWAIIRQNYPQLRSTTITTWEDWVGSRVVFNAPITTHIRSRLEDGTILDLEVYFLATQYASDIKKLTSLNLTGAWINEAREVPPEIFQAVKGRLGRYPDEQAGGCTWTGVIMDTNGPPIRHWLHHLVMVDKPVEVSFYKQPPALLKVPRPDGTIQWIANPLAENVENITLGYKYWRNMIPGATMDFLNVYIGGDFGNVFTGRPVYEQWYSAAFHVAKEELKPKRGLPLVLCWDFGLTPACVAIQKTLMGQIQVLREWCFPDGGLEQFCSRVIRPALQDPEFRGMDLHSWADPAGKQRSQNDEVTPISILNRYGFKCEAAPSNDFSIRWEAVTAALGRWSAAGPGLLLDPRCTMLIEGFQGGYTFKRLPTEDGRSAFKDEPEKNEYSHPHDALQYGVLGEFGAPQRRKALALPRRRASWAGAT